MSNIYKHHIPIVYSYILTFKLYNVYKMMRRDHIKKKKLYNCGIFRLTNFIQHFIMYFYEKQSK